MLYRNLLKVAKFFNRNQINDEFNEIDEKIIISILGSLMCLFQSILTGIEGLSVVSSLLFFTSILIFILLLFLKNGFVFEKRFSHLSCLSFSFLVISINIVSGVIYSPSKIWIGLLPIFSIIYTGIFSGAIYTVISSFILFICSSLYSNGFLSYNEFSPLQIQAMGTRNLLFAPMLYLVFFGYYFSKTRYLLQTSSHLAKMGASYSFFVHEISKPLSRLVRKKEDFNHDKDINSVFDLYSMMNQLHAEDPSRTSIQEVDFEKVVNEILDRYADYLKLYKINLDIRLSDYVLKTDEKILYVFLDNIFRNAIENSKGHSGDYVIEVFQNLGVITIKNPINPKFNIDSVELHPVGFSTKEGHMGVGLFLIKKLASRLGFMLNISIQEKKFVVEFSDIKLNQI